MLRGGQRLRVPGNYIGSVDRRSGVHNLQGLAWHTWVPGIGWVDRRSGVHINLQGLAWHMSHLRSRSKALAGHLYEACCSTEEDRARIASTGQLVPSGSLKFKAVRSRLSWVKDLSAGRFFTKRRVHEAIVDLFLEHDIQLPSVPGFSQAKWLEEQSTSLTKVLQRARRSTAMDPSLAETQAWDFEDRFLCCVTLALWLDIL